MFIVFMLLLTKKINSAQIVESLKLYNALPYSIVVSATASDSAPLQFLAPYSGCAIGEFLEIAAFML